MTRNRNNNSEICWLFDLSDSKLNAQMGFDEITEVEITWKGPVSAILLTELVCPSIVTALATAIKTKQ